MAEHVQTEAMRLPRFLWVPFELGRPFGIRPGQDREAGLAGDEWTTSCLLADLDGPAEVTQLLTEPLHRRRSRRVLEQSDGSYEIVNRNSGKALDNWEGTTTSGSRVSQYTRSGSAVQRWRLIPIQLSIGSSMPRVTICPA